MRGYAASTSTRSTTRPGNCPAPARRFGRKQPGSHDLRREPLAVRGKHEASAHLAYQPALCATTHDQAMGTARGSVGRGRQEDRRAGERARQRRTSALGQPTLGRRLNRAASGAPRATELAARRRARRGGRSAQVAVGQECDAARARILRAALAPSSRRRRSGGWRGTR